MGFVHSPFSYDVLTVKKNDSCGVSADTQGRQKLEVKGTTQLPNLTDSSF
jgi:hypothetical protein